MRAVRPGCDSTTRRLTPERRAVVSGERSQALTSRPSDWTAQSARGSMADALISPFTPDSV